MSDLQFDLSGLADADRAIVARHFAQSYSMIYGSAERMDALYFRVPVEDCLDRSPVAGALRDLVAQLESDAPRVRLRMAALDVYGACHMAEVFRRTELRVQRDTARDDGLDSAPAAAVSAMRRVFERRARLPEEGVRAQYLQWPADPAQRQAIQDAMKRDAAARRDELRRGEAVSRGVVVTPLEVGDGDDDTFRVVAPAAREFMPSGIGRR